MKKFIYLLFFQILFYPCFADDFIRPNWKEFCPKRYENVNKDVWRYTSSGRYWSKRKKDFEVKLKNCDMLNEVQRTACYNNLRENELDKTKVFMKEKRGKAFERMVINSMLKTY